MPNQLFQIPSIKDQFAAGISREIKQPSTEDKDYSDGKRVIKGGFLEILYKNISRTESAKESVSNPAGLGAIFSGRNLSMANRQNNLGELFAFHQGLNDFTGNGNDIYSNPWNNDFMRIKDETLPQVEPGKDNIPKNEPNQEVHDELEELEEREKRIQDELKEKILEKIHLLLAQLRDIQSLPDKLNAAHQHEKDDLHNALGKLEITLKELIHKLNKSNPHKKSQERLSPAEAKEFQARLQAIIDKLASETNARSLSDEKINSLLKSLNNFAENPSWKEISAFLKDRQMHSPEKPGQKPDNSISGRQEIQASAKWGENFISRDRHGEISREAHDERGAIRVSGQKVSSEAGVNTEKGGSSDFKKFASGDEKNRPDLKSPKGEFDTLLQKTRVDAKSVSKKPATGLKNLSNAEIRKVIEQIVQRSRLFQRGNSRYRFTANLKPQWLGKVTVQVDYDHGTMLGKFLVETKELKEILKSNLGFLKKELAGEGVNVHDFEVVLREDEQKSFLSFGEKKGTNFREEIVSRDVYTENIEQREEAGVRQALEKKAFDMRA